MWGPAGAAGTAAWAAAGSGTEGKPQQFWGRGGKGQELSHSPGAQPVSL